MLGDAWKWLADGYSPDSYDLSLHPELGLLRHVPRRGRAVMESRKKKRRHVPPFMSDEIIVGYSFEDRAHGPHRTLP